MTLHYRMLMTCLKYLSSCPCPRCLLLRTKISRIGSKSDMRDRLKLVRVDSDTRRNTVDLARKLLFEKGVNITSTRIKDILEKGSLTLTRVCIKFGSLFLTNFLQNAFSERLFSHGFNFYQMFTVDLLHEFELGVWKAIFTHLLRILYAHGNGMIQELNKRYDVMTPYFFFNWQHLQLPRCSSIWSRYHSKIFKQCLWVETTGCKRLRGSTSGMLLKTIWYFVLW